LRSAAGSIVSYLQGGKDAVDSASKGHRDAGLTGRELPENRSLAGVLGYYVATGSGRSQGWARGSGAAAMGLAGAVSAPELETVLLGCHAQSSERLLGATGSSGRADGVPLGARPVACHGDPDELLTLAEAAFLAAVRPGYLRRLAEQQPQMVFPTQVSGDQIDPRLARRLFEVMAGAPVTAPATALLLAHKDPASGEWRVRRGEVERFIADRVVPETVMGFDMVCSAPKSVSLL
jgi:TrwC relaxase